ncbi:hypothetical protein HMPREF9701_04927 [Delftia acidovorans CCUG 274B]|uniref:hypothetical protein n=1 Tax=Delftia acidovorans TaxID=80866 RepID=UPI0003528F65|nr:hypothetical protein [Delftia acidovorans]EPD36108.1 hypothetical protein HMPREF9701_04927 [Delftia acidovorans CCUG 274B]
MSKTETQSEALRLAALLQCGADDPMWILHCEMLKQTVGDAAATLRRLDAENIAHKADVMSFHYAMKDAGWHPGRTDDLLTDIIRAKGKELIQVHAENKALRARRESPAAQAGWKLVPAKPTDAMLGAAQKAWLADPLRRSSTLYAAALAAAPQAPVMDATAERDEAFEAVRQRLCKLPKYSFILADGDGGAVGVARRKDGSGRWIEFQAAHELFDPVAVDAALAPQAAAKNGGAA